MPVAFRKVGNPLIKIKTGHGALKKSGGAENAEDTSRLARITVELAKGKASAIFFCKESAF